MYINFIQLITPSSRPTTTADNYHVIRNRLTKNQTNLKSQDKTTHRPTPHKNTHTPALNKLGAVANYYSNYLTIQPINFLFKKILNQWFFQTTSVTASYSWFITKKSSRSEDQLLTPSPTALFTAYTTPYFFVRRSSHQQNNYDTKTTQTWI